MNPHAAITIKKSSCDKPKLGATSGGCAFEEAHRLPFFLMLMWFISSMHLQRVLGHRGRQELHLLAGRENNVVMGYSTDITTNDVIFGGHKKLEASIEYIVAHKNPKALFIYETCVTAMIWTISLQECKKSTAS
jgi:nitrogenase molybdenum-cofactor synthesis protein NifE